MAMGCSRLQAALPCPAMAPQSPCLALSLVMAISKEKVTMESPPCPVCRTIPAAPERRSWVSLEILGGATQTPQREFGLTKLPA